MSDLEQLRYPVGKAPRIKELDRETRARLIDTIAETPARFRSLVAGLSDAQLDTPYRPGGWTIRQVVHHVPDSHMNAYIRMKLALTEETPTIRPYEEDRWAELPEAKSGPVDMSLTLLDALHRRWVALLRALPEADFRKTYTHPDLGVVSLDEAIGLYEWHCRHHAAHIENGIRSHAAHA
jgi:DinB family protein